MAKRAYTIRIGRNELNRSLIAFANVLWIHSHRTPLWEQLFEEQKCTK